MRTKKKLWKKTLAGILVLVLSMGLLSTTAFAVEDNIVVIREDVEIEDDFTINGELYIVEGAHLVTTGEVTIYGDVYVFGSWRNTGEISGEGTIHCLHYNSSSLSYDTRGHFSSSTNSGGRNPSLATSIDSSYLSMSIPEGHTYDPETGETSGPEPEDEPDSEPEDEPDSEPEDEPDSEPEDTTDSEPEDTTDSGTKSSTGSAKHSYDFDNIVWEWTADYSAANAFVYCVDGDGAVKAYEAEIESYSNTYGGTTYVATITDENGNVYSGQVELDSSGKVVEEEADAVSTLSAGSGDSSSGSGSSESSGSSDSTGDTDSTSSTGSGDSGSGHSGSGHSGSGHSSSGSGSSGSSGSGSGSSHSSSGSGSSGSSGSSSGYSSSGSSGSGYTGSSGSSSGYSSSGGSSSAVSSSKTDDSAAPYLYLAMILFAGAAVTTVGVRRRVTRG